MNQRRNYMGRKIVLYSMFLSVLASLLFLIAAGKKLFAADTRAQAATPESLAVLDIDAVQYIAPHHRQ
jgi:hypothetical protein